MCRRCCIELCGDPVTRGVAIRGLAEFDHPDTAQALLDGYGSFDAAGRQDAVQTLASRPAWAAAAVGRRRGERRFPAPT